MTVSKRSRFEVLRRDGFRCHYCHLQGSADGTGLTIDHVVPVALGGTDDPANLVAACADCNAGKASVPPDAELVAEVDRAVAIQQAARSRARLLLSIDLASEDDYEAQVLELWDRYVPSYKRNALPANFVGTVSAWHADRVPFALIEKGIRIAVGAANVPWPGKWNYAAGVVRNTIRRIEEEVAAGA